MYLIKLLKLTKTFNFNCEFSINVAENQKTKAQDYVKLVINAVVGKMV